MCCLEHNHRVKIYNKIEVLRLTRVCVMDCRTFLSRKKIRNSMIVFNVLFTFLRTSIRLMSSLTYENHSKSISFNKSYATRRFLTWHPCEGGDLMTLELVSTQVRVLQHDERLEFFKANSLLLDNAR